MEASSPAAQTVAAPSPTPLPLERVSAPTPAAGPESDDEVRAEMGGNRQLPFTNYPYPAFARQRIEADKRMDGLRIRLSVVHPLPEGQPPAPRPEQSHGLKPVPDEKSALKRTIAEPNLGRLENDKEGSQPTPPLSIADHPLPLPTDRWPTLPEQATAVPPDGEAAAREWERRRRLEREQRGQVWNE